MKRIVLCDIDHVVSQSFRRDAMIGGVGGWDAYHEAAKDDQPVQDVVSLIHALEQVHEVWGLTARPEKWRQPTLEWLGQHDVFFTGLLMRPDRDFRPSPLVKIDLAKAKWPILKDHIAVLIEDRDDVCAAFRAEGIVCLQCHISPGVAPSIPFTCENEKGVA